MLTKPKTHFKSLGGFGFAYFVNLKPAEFWKNANLGDNNPADSLKIANLGDYKLFLNNLQSVKEYTQYIVRGCVATVQSVLTSNLASYTCLWQS